MVHNLTFLMRMINNQQKTIASLFQMQEVEQQDLYQSFFSITKITKGSSQQQISNHNNYQYLKQCQDPSLNYYSTMDERLQFFTANNSRVAQASSNGRDIYNQLNSQLEDYPQNQSLINNLNEPLQEDNYWDQFFNYQENSLLQQQQQQQQLHNNPQFVEQVDQYYQNMFDHRTQQECLFDYQEVKQYNFEKENQLNLKEDHFTPIQSNLQQAIYQSQIEQCSNLIVESETEKFNQEQANLNINQSFQFHKVEQINNINVSRENKSLNQFNYNHNNTEAQAEIINTQQIRECCINFQTPPPVNIQSQSDSYLQQYNHINKSIDKKNVVKNIMNQFKSFVLINKECFSEVDQTKKGFQKNLKSLFSLEEINSKNQQIVSIYNKFKQKQETISQIQKKFQRYIKSKSFNNYSLILLIQHQQYKFVFKYFLNNYAKLWLDRSKINNIDSHIQIIDFLLDSFENPDILTILKKHDKKKSVYS